MERKLRRTENRQGFISDIDSGYVANLSLHG